MKNKALALLLAAALCLGMIPPALAYGGGQIGRAAVIGAGDNHTAMVGEDGSLWTWGRNDCGQLGNGTTEDSAIPVKVMDDVVSVACGDNFTAAIKKDGTLWTWGDNQWGQLGDGTRTNATAPMQVLDNVAAVGCGEHHAAAVKKDGSLWTWGTTIWTSKFTFSRELGGKETTGRLIPDKVMDDVLGVSCGYFFTYALKFDGTLCYANGKKVMENVISMAAGTQQNIAVQADGSLWSWGSSVYGELGDGEIRQEDVGLRKIKNDSMAVAACGSNHSAAITADGTLYMWGRGSAGQIGNGSTAFTNTRPLAVMNNVESVCGGDEHTVVLKKDGSVWACGSNEYGQLGTGGKESQSSFVQIGTRSCVWVQLRLNGGEGDTLRWVDAKHPLSSMKAPTRPGYIFDKWYADAALATPWDMNSAPTPGLVLYAGWTPLFKIRFVLNGGVGETSLETPAGSPITPPSNPTRAGYEFDGWCTDASLGILWDFNSPAQENLILYARWKAASAVPAPATSFVDVPAGAYYEKPVAWAVENGITTGTGTDTFSPARPCTRGQAVTFLWRAMGKPEPTTAENPFTDVSEGDYFYKAVLWAYENGITTGNGDGTFTPGRICSRAQVAAFLWRAKGKPKAGSPADFSDVDSGAFYAEAVAWAVEHKITGGTGDGLFSPNADCVRGQMVTFLYRAFAE